VDLRGYGGTLAVGYQRAATIRAWALQFDPQHQRGVVTVTYGGIDTFWIQQRPLDLTLHIEGRSWIWRNVQPAEEDQTSIVTSGAPESAR
jgi:hypothetical protein